MRRTNPRGITRLQMTESTQTPEAGQAAGDVLKMDINEVMRRLPHRYPFLLVDRVLECVSGKHIRALKNVTINEPFFPGTSRTGRCSPA